MIELLIVVVLMGVMATLAMPGLGSMVKKNQGKAAILGLYNAFSLAQSEASRRRFAVTVKAVNYKWHNGWKAFSDINRDRRWNSGDSLLHVGQALNGAIQLKNSPKTDRIQFLPSGAMTSKYSSTIYFFVCSPKQTKPTHVLSVQPSGNLLMIGKDNDLFC